MSWWVYTRVRVEALTIWKRIKYAFQRMFRGYDDEQALYLNECFIENYIKILKRKKKSMLYPASCDSYEEWQNIIDSMIYHLEMMSEDSYDLVKRDYEDYGSFRRKVYDSRKKMDKHKEDFFLLFSRYFFEM